MNGAAMASFQSAAETPDRDDEEEHPDVDCGHCGAYLGSHPCDEYVDCEECGGATRSQWAPEPAEPTDEEIAQREAAWAEASRRGFDDDADAQRTRAEAAEAEVARQSEGYQRVMRQASALALARDEAEAEVARLRATIKAAVDALRAEERDVTGVDPYSEGGRYALGYRDGVRRALAALTTKGPTP